jgi:peptidoglycan/LPS O-acetylase OafA/YrhL
MVSPFTSVALDLTRFLLALAVAAGHWTQPWFQTGWPDLTDIGVACVGGFFVLSGFTIRMLTRGSQAFAPSSFLVDRLSRLWSVVLPAATLTLILDGLSRIANGAYYMGNWARFTTHPLLRVCVNFLFLNEVWGLDIGMLSDSLFWSLGYEACFHLIYALFRARKGTARCALTAAGCVLAGPNILLMLTPWLLGVLMYDALAKINIGRRKRPTVALVAFIATAIGIWCGVVVFRGSLFLVWSRETTSVIYGGFAAAERNISPFFFGIPFRPARIDGRLVVGTLLFLVFFVPMMIVAQLLDNVAVLPRLGVSVLRRVGDFTFPLYLMHFPIFVFIGALGFYDPDRHFRRLCCSWASVLRSSHLRPP